MAPRIARRSLCKHGGAHKTDWIGRLTLWWFAWKGDISPDFAALQALNFELEHFDIACDEAIRWLAKSHRFLPLPWPEPLEWTGCTYLRGSLSFTLPTNLTRHQCCPWHQSSKERETICAEVSYSTFTGTKNNVPAKNSLGLISHMPLCQRLPTSVHWGIQVYSQTSHRFNPKSLEVFKFAHKPESIKSEKPQIPLYNMMIICRLRFRTNSPPTSPF